MILRVAPSEALLGASRSINPRTGGNPNASQSRMAVVRRRRGSSSEGHYGITSPGITERVNTSAPGLGVALSKAQTLAVALQRELRAMPEEPDITIRITPLGKDTVARVIVRRDVIETYA